MFKIGDFSTLNRITVKTLRHYDELGLLKPAYIDAATGYRYYSADQLPRLNKILMFKSIGFSLQEILDILEHKLTVDDMITQLEHKQAEILTAVKAQQAQISQIQAFIKMINQEVNYMNYDVLIKTIPEMAVASMRATLDSYPEQQTLWYELETYLDKEKINRTSPEYCFTQYHNHEYREKDIDLEICEAVTELKPNTEKVTFKKLPAIHNMASVIHKGPYETIHLAYAALTKWIETNNYTICGPGRDLYLKGPWNETNPEEWITEIHIPVDLK